MGKRNIFLLLLLVTSSVGYLEWPGGNHGFLWEIEWLIIRNLPHHPQNLLHPIIIFPFLSQVLLLISLFYRSFSKKKISWILLPILLLYLLILFIGISTKNWKIFISSLPFFLSVMGYWKLNN